MHKDLNRGTSAAHPDSYKKFEEQIAANPDNYGNIDIRTEYDGPPANAGSVTRLSDVNPSDRVPTQLEAKWVDENGVPRYQDFKNIRP